MKDSIISKEQTTIIIFIFCISHLIIWTISSELFRSSVTHDTLEGIAWGYQWQLGYSKHPFVAAWLSAAITKLFGGVIGWPVYLLSQIAVITTLLTNFFLARKIFNESYALISVLLLEGIIYFNINSINFTPDTAQTPFWALTAFCFYHAIKHQKFKFWFLTSLFAAISFLTKYSALFLFISMFFVCLFTNDGRKSFRNRNLYINVLTFFILISPHLYWLYQNNLSSINYINTSFSEKPSLFHHIYYPIKYSIGQIGILSGLLIISWPLWKDKRKSSKLSFDEKFILIMGLTPILLTIIYSGITGHHIIQRWSTPYYYLAGMVFLTILKPNISNQTLNKTIKTAFIALFFICFSRNVYYMWWPNVTKKARADCYLPNKEIAAKITSIWNEKFQTKLSFIAGDHYLTAYISAYSTDKPIPYMNLNKVESPWIKNEEINKNGAVFAWPVNNLTEEEIDSIFQNAKKQFSKIEKIGIYSFDKSSNYKDNPVKILIAILHPF